jgi:hypothetical protein
MSISQLLKLPITLFRSCLLHNQCFNILKVFLIAFIS